jgi:hypothetical protein
MLHRSELTADTTVGPRQGCAGLAIGSPWFQLAPPNNYLTRVQVLSRL